MPTIPSVGLQDKLKLEVEQMKQIKQHDCLVTYVDREKIMLFKKYI
jgi:hypothetical protein